MLSGYSDVAGFFMEENGTSPPYQDDQSAQLPNEYLPKFPPPDPWHKLSSCPEDFLMIAEFSEQEGPKPLLTIPDDLSSRMDLNDFSVKIMSVDFQTVTSEKFTVSEDTQVVISQNQHGVHAYIHHFTLYDSQARGFVRPFCMTYVTPDSRKIMSFYEDLQSEFNTVSKWFKYGNLQLFENDMTHYLTDLRYTKEQFKEHQCCNEELDEAQRGQSSEGDIILQSVTQHGLEAAIKEVINILETINDMLNDNELRSKFEKMQLKYQGEIVSPEQESLTFDKFHYSMSLIEEKPPPPSPQIKKYGSCSDIPFYTHAEEFIYKPKLVRTTNKRRFDKNLRSLDTLCQLGADEGKKRLTTIYKYFCRDMATLSVERKDSKLMDPGCGLLSIGRNVEVNFLTELNFDGIPPPGIKPSESVFSGRWDDSSSFQSAESFLSCQDDLGYDEKQSLTSYDIISYEDASGEFLAKKEQSDAGDMIKSTVSGCSSVANSNISKPLNEKILLFSSVDHLHCMGPNLPGYGIKKVVQDFPFCPHLLYAILCGRLVAVVGSIKAEKLVTNMVNSLAMFVPGHSNQSIVKWQTYPLKLSQLNHLKLVGLCLPDKRSLDQFISANIKRHITMFDIEKKVLVTPGYQGGIVTDICNKHKGFSSNTAYIAYIHSVLVELSSKAYIYFHAFCLQPQKKYDCDSMGQEWRRIQQNFFTKLKVGSDDSLIIQHLCDIIVGQQLKEYSLPDDYPDFGNRRIFLSNRKCGLFKI